MESEQTRWQELLDTAYTYTPDLVPVLMYAREGGAVVNRYKSGKKQGMLYVSMSPRAGSDYSRWDQLNCGPGLKMYQEVQAITKKRWDDDNPPNGGSVPRSA